MWNPLRAWRHYRRASDARRAVAILRQLSPRSAGELGVVKAAAEEAYKIAQRSRTSSVWDPENVAGDTAIAESVELGGARAREQVRNNPQFRGALNKLIDIIVGQGIRAFSAPFSFDFDVTALLTSEADDELAVNESLTTELQFAYESDRWFDRWAEDPQQCDVEGKLSFWDMQRLAFSEVAEVGDVLLHLVQLPGRGRLVPLAFQLIEREQLDRSKDRPAEAGQNKIVNGIELDPYNRPVRYWVYDAHPDDSTYSPWSASSRGISADRILHPFVAFRPSMHVGFSWFHAMAQVARDRHWLVGSELTKAALGALLTLVHYCDNPAANTISLDDGDDAEDSHGNPLVKLATGGVSMRAGVNDKVEMFNPNTPSQQLPNFIDVIDHDAAAGIGLSHLRYTGRWSKLSYTAGRGAQLDDELHAKPLKNWWGRACVLPIRRLVNAQMIAMGRVRAVSASEFRRDELRYQSFFCVGPGREMLDPENETESALAKLRSGLTTLQIENGKLGQHWLEILMQARREMLVTRLLGLKLDFSKGQGGQTSSTSTDAAAATAATGDDSEEDA